MEAIVHQTVGPDPGNSGGYTPFRIDVSKPAVEEERIPLFYIGDTEYTGPRRVSAGTALRVLEIAASEGIAAATFHCLISAIGEDGYAALKECPQLTYEDAQALCSKVAAMYFGQAMDMAGK